jgi:thiol peroxidase
MQIKFKGKIVNLEGTQVKLGDKIKFNATNRDFSQYKFDTQDKWTVISFFPSIDTSVCDRQTRKVLDLAEKYSSFNFLSISVDIPPALSRWCLVNSRDNINIVSDYQERQFGLDYGLMIKELKLLSRGLIIVNPKSEVKYVQILEEVSSDPDFTDLENNIKQLVKSTAK